VKILLEHFSAELISEDVFTLRLGSESLCENSNDNGIRGENIVTLKSLSGHDILASEHL
jgi:hypothetical protein